MLAWDAQSCAAKAGYWAALNDGSTDSGCWYMGGAGQSCSTVCSGYQLSCVERSWNDDSSDSICAHLAPAVSLHQPRDPVPAACAPAWLGGYGGICGRVAEGHGNQACDCTPGYDAGGNGGWMRFCACAP